MGASRVSQSAQLVLSFNSFMVVYAGHDVYLTKVLNWSIWPVFFIFYREGTRTLGFREDIIKTQMSLCVPSRLPAFAVKPHN